MRSSYEFNAALLQYFKLSISWVSIRTSSVRSLFKRSSSSCLERNLYFNCSISRSFSRSSACNESIRFCANLRS